MPKNPRLNRKFSGKKYSYIGEQQSKKRNREQKEKILRVQKQRGRPVYIRTAKLSKGYYVIWTRPKTKKR